MPATVRHLYTFIERIMGVAAYWGACFPALNKSQLRKWVESITAPSDFSALCDSTTKLLLLLKFAKKSSFTPRLHGTLHRFPAVLEEAPNVLLDIKHVFHFCWRDLVSVSAGWARPGSPQEQPADTACYCSVVRATNGAQQFSLRFPSLFFLLFWYWQLHNRHTVREGRRTD